MEIVYTNYEYFKTVINYFSVVKNNKEVYLLIPIRSQFIKITKQNIFGYK